MRSFDDAKLQSLMQEHGVACSLLQFQQIVNVIFHRFESEVYDSMHRCMWQSLPRQFELLASDILHNASLADGLHLLDVGSGTGLSTELLLRTPLGNKIDRITLLDTSKEMLERTEKRSRRWKRKCEIHLGQIDSIQQRFDIILTCSVLHHIPDLSSFMREVVQHLNSGGVFLHLQDPNGDYLGGPDLKKRMERAMPSNGNISFMTKIRWRTNRLLGRNNYLAKVNDSLLRQGVIIKPMSDEAMWCFTDIHDSGGYGISVEDINRDFPDLKLLAHRSYAFFGRMASELTPTLRRDEELLTRQLHLDGAKVAAAWQKI